MITSLLSNPWGRSVRLNLLLIIFHHSSGFAGPSLVLFFFYFSLIRRIAHFGSCVPFQVLCFFSLKCMIWYMALYVHHQGLRQKASFDWPTYLTLTKQILSSVCNCLQPKKISLPILEQIGDHNDQLTMCTSFQPSWEDLEKTKVLSSQIFVSAWYGTEGKSSCHFLAKWYISLFLANPIPSTALFDILDAKSVSCSRNTFPSCLLPLANVTLEM